MVLCVQERQENDRRTRGHPRRWWRDALGRARRNNNDTIASAGSSSSSSSSRNRNRSSSNDDGDGENNISSRDIERNSSGESTALDATVVYDSSCANFSSNATNASGPFSSWPHLILEGPKKWQQRPPPRCTSRHRLKPFAKAECLDSGHSNDIVCTLMQSPCHPFALNKYKMNQCEPNQCEPPGRVRGASGPGDVRRRVAVRRSLSKQRASVSSD